MLSTSRRMLTAAGTRTVGRGEAPVTTTSVNGHVRMRAATVEDLAALLELVPRLAATGSPPGRDTSQVEASDRKAIENAIARPAGAEIVLIAEEAQLAVGFIHVKTVTDYFTQQPIAHVSDVVVAEAAEGRGVGKLLMGAAEDWARGRGYLMIQLHVLVGNGRARAMYERLGYTAEWFKYIKALD
jgi:ribosomal protein S18 acetylase RimI-like enzyme